jgi:hypothetical protein
MNILGKSLKSRNTLVTFHYMGCFITPGCGLHIYFFAGSNKSSIVEL